MPSSVKASFLNALSQKHREQIAKAYSREDPSASFFSLMKRIADEMPSDKGETMEDAVEYLEEHAPELAPKLKRRAFFSLATFLGETGARKARENIREKNRYRRKQALAATFSKTSS